MINLMKWVISAYAYIHFFFNLFFSFSPSCLLLEEQRSLLSLFHQPYPQPLPLGSWPLHPSPSTQESSDVCVACRHRPGLGGAWSVPRRQGRSWILPDVGGLSSGPDGGQEDGWETRNFRVSQRRRTQATSHRCACFSGEGRGDLISRDLGAGSAGSWVPEALVPESSGRIRAPDACGASPRPRGRLAHRTQSHRAAAPRPGPARYFIYICIIL